MHFDNLRTFPNLLLKRSSSRMLIKLFITLYDNISVLYGVSAVWQLLKLLENLYMKPTVLDALLTM